MEYLVPCLKVIGSGLNQRFGSRFEFGLCFLFWRVALRSVHGGTHFYQTSLTPNVYSPFGLPVKVTHSIKVVLHGSTAMSQRVSVTTLQLA